MSSENSAKSRKATPKECATCGDELPDPIPVVKPVVGGRLGYCSEECYDGN